MKRKIRKLLFELSNNCRISTKQLGKKINSSQQSASYLVRQLEKKRKIKYYTLVDPVKLGYVNIIVGFDYLNFEREAKKQVIDKLLATEQVIRVEEATQGVDLVVEYCASNLSSFNKTHSDIIYKFRKILQTKFILTVIVKHIYAKNYLVNGRNDTDLIICGDRETRKLSENDMKVLRELIANPVETFSSMSKNTKVSVKSIIKSKKRLEKFSVIRGYSCFIDEPKFGIRRYFIFLNLAGYGVEEIRKLQEFALTNKNIVEMVKTIGNYQIMLIVEELNKTELIKELRSQFPVEKYFVVEVDKIHLLRYFPLEAINI
ncbi:winged helix-turn-helix transcriptional regulator [Candidatus Woesearchaeota archaeon]|nr:MAG: winged helix-turn-helix transcriptional regulator [Candidatus Woesearchaeota archaeon]